MDGTARRWQPNRCNVQSQTQKAESIKAKAQGASPKPKPRVLTPDGQANEQFLCKVESAGKRNFSSQLKGAMA